MAATTASMAGTRRSPQPSSCCLLAQHADRVSAPFSASMNLVDDRQGAATLTWTVGPEQTFNGGQLLQRPRHDDSSRIGKAARAEAGLARDLGDDDDAAEGEDGCAVAGGRAAEVCHAPRAPGELWPVALRTGRGRMPSLAPRDADERERAAASNEPAAR